MLYLQSRGNRFRYVYLAWRLFWALYHTIWIILTGVFTNQYATTEANRVKWFIYLTNWAYFVLTLASIVQLIVVIYKMVKQPANESGEYPLLCFANISYDQITKWLRCCRRKMSNRMHALKHSVNRLLKLYVFVYIIMSDACILL